MDTTVATESEKSRSAAVDFPIYHRSTLFRLITLTARPRGQQSLDIKGTAHLLDTLTSSMGLIDFKIAAKLSSFCFKVIPSDLIN